MRVTKLLITAIAMLPLSVFAQGYYAGGGLGLSKFEDNIPGGNGDPAVPNQISDSEAGFKIFGGYKFSPNWSTEIGYVDYGSAKGAFKSLDFEMEATGIYLSGAYHWVFLKNFSADFSLGLVRSEGKSSMNPKPDENLPGPCEGANPLPICNNKDTVWGLSGGLGLTWNIGEKVATRLMFEGTTLQYEDNTGTGGGDQFEMPYRIGIDAYWKF